MLYKDIPVELQDLKRRIEDRGAAIRHLEKMYPKEGKKIMINVNDSYVYVDVESLQKAMIATNQIDEVAVAKLEEANEVLTKVAKGLV